MLGVGFEHVSCTLRPDVFKTEHVKISPFLKLIRLKNVPACLVALQGLLQLGCQLHTPFEISPILIPGT